MSDFERWPDLDSLLEQALDQPAGLRPAFLERVCGEDADLRRELEALIAAHEAAAGFLEDPAAWLGPLPGAPPPEPGADPGADRWLGRTILHYEVLERVGAGGMGVVYKARDTRLDRIVALKFLRPWLGMDREAKSRFMQEARAASALDHAGICTIHDIDETADGQLFIAMAYYDGETLAERLAREPLPVEGAIDIAIAIGESLGRAHEAGIVHRDLKPANVMLTARGEVKVLDFGIAKLEGEDQTRTGARLGTAAYMSPEQASGRRVDRRTDIWALGAVLYEMAAGQRPFPGANEQATIYAILNEEPRPVTELRDAVPAGLDSVLRRALAKPAAERYADMDALLDDLRALATGVPVAAPASARSHGSRSRRRWLVAGALGAAAVVTAIVTARPGTRGGPAGADPVLALPAGPSIAVIPFVNRSADSGDVYFSDGLSEDLVGGLSRFSGLFVFSLGSTMRYKGSVVDVREVGRALGVDFVLQGTVRRSPGRIRVTATLAKAADGETIWSEAFDLDANTAELFDAQDRIRDQVVGAIGGSTGVIARAGMSAARARPTASLDAYQCVLRAYEYLVDHGPPAHVRARACLEEAVRLDPDYVDAWGWLAYTYAEENRHGWNRRPDYDPLDRALAAAQRAVNLDPANYMGHFGLAVTYFDAHDIEQFKLAGERALELNPNDANVLAFLGDYLYEAGETERGLALLRKSMALNPSHPGWLFVSFFLDRYAHHDYEAALGYARRINAPTYYRAAMFEAVSLAQLGRREEAATALRRMRELRPDLVTTADVRADLRQYNHTPEVVDHLFDGLRKAGLPDSVPRQPPERVRPQV